MKKIFSILLVLAVAFSFAACNNGVVFPQNTDKAVLSVTLESAPEYIVGEVLDPADVTLRVVYGDRTEDTFTGAELGMTGTFKLSSGENSFTVVYGSFDAEDNLPIWNIKITPYSLDKLTVDPTDAVKTVDQSTNGATVDEKGLKYTGTYNGKTVSVSETVAEANFANLSFTVDASAEKKGVAVKVADTVAGKDKITISPEWIVDVVKATDKNAIVFVKIEQLLKPALEKDDGSFEIFNVTGTTQKLADLHLQAVVTNGNNVSETVSLTAATDGNGYTGTTKAGETVKLTWDSYVNGKSLAGMGTSIPAAVTVTKRGETTPYFTEEDATVILQYTPDYPTACTATANKTFWEGDRVSAADFNLEVTVWASGRTADKNSYPASSYFEIALEDSWVKTPATENTMVDVTLNRIVGAKTINTGTVQYKLDNPATT